MIEIESGIFLLWRRAVACLLALVILSRPFVLYVCAEETETASDFIAESFYRFDTVVDISDYALTLTELSRIFSCVLKDDPYLFFVSGNLRYSYSASGAVLTLTPRYTMTREEYQSAASYCRKRINAMAALAEHFESDAERALFLHDLICENFEYDDMLQNNGIYDFLLTGRGTCEAYMLLYTALLRECGIESHFAASDTLAHIWNVVLIDSEWYHVDVTWDDSASSGTVSRRHFACSDAEAVAKGHRDWYCPTEVHCISDAYESIDFDGLLPMAVAVGDVDHDGQVALLDLLLLRSRQTQAFSETDFCDACADVNLDGTVDGDDIELLRRKLLASD